MIAELPDFVIKALEDLGFVKGLYGEVPYEVRFAWSTEDDTQSYNLILNGRQLGDIVVHYKGHKVKFNFDYAGWLRGMSRQEQKIAQLMRGFGMGSKQMAAGLSKIAHAMSSSSVKISSDYRSVGRQIAIAEKMPESQHLTYDKDVKP